MIAYFIHAGVISNGRIGWMRVAGDDRARHHSDTRVETNHPSLLFWMSRNKVWTMLFSPLMFHISVSGDHSVGLVILVGKVGYDKKVGTTQERQDGVRFGVQFGS